MSKTPTLTPVGPKIEPVETPQGDGGFVNTFFDPVQRGFNTLQAGVAMTLGDTMDAAEQQRQRARIPDSGRMAEFGAGSDDLLPSLAHLFTNPATAIEVIGEGIGTSAPTMIAQLGQLLLTKNPSMLANAAGAGGSSTAIEYGTIALEALAEHGFNPQDPSQIVQGMESPEVLADIERRGAGAGAVGAFDAASVLMSGKIGSKVARLLQPKGDLGVMPAVAGLGAEGVAQGLMGGAGEAAKQIVQGKEISGQDVAAEIVGELGPGAVEVALGTKAQRYKQSLEGAVESYVNAPSQPTPEKQQAQEAAAIAEGRRSYGMEDDGSAPIAAAPVNATERGEDEEVEPTLTPVGPAIDPSIASQSESGAAEGTLAPEPTESMAGGIPEPTEIEEPAPPVKPVEPVEPVEAEPPQTVKVTTAKDREVDVSYEIVEADDLLTSDDSQYPQDLQPRDRSKASSDVQINKIANNLDPARLGESPTADRGAPIIGRIDNIVESGNGRVSAIRKAYELGNMDDYRAEAERITGQDTSEYSKPVLVRRRQTDMSRADRREFAKEANQSETMSMSATEQAQADADAVRTLIPMMNGGDVTSAGNRDFIKAWIKTLPDSERNAVIDQNGQLSQSGLRRVQGAILAVAYGGQGSNEFLSKILESTDDNVRSVTGAMIDVAQAYAEFRAGLSEDQQQYDIAPNLIEAAELVRSWRQQGKKVSEELNQTDLLGDRDAVTDYLIKAFYNDDLTRAVGREKIGEFLTFYIDGVTKETSQDGLFGGETLSTEQFLQAGLDRRDDDKQEQGDLLGGQGQSQSADNNGASANQGGDQTPEPEPATAPEPEPEPEPEAQEVRESPYYKPEITSPSQLGMRLDSDLRQVNPHDGRKVKAILMYEIPENKTWDQTPRETLNRFNEFVETYTQEYDYIDRWDFSSYGGWSGTNWPYGTFEDVVNSFNEAANEGYRDTIRKELDDRYLEAKPSGAERRAINALRRELSIAKDMKADKSIEVYQYMEDNNSIAKLDAARKKDAANKNAANKSGWTPKLEEAAKLLSQPAEDGVGNIEVHPNKLLEAIKKDLSKFEQTDHIKALTELAEGLREGFKGNPENEKNTLTASYEYVSSKQFGGSFDYTVNSGDPTGTRIEQRLVFNPSDAPSMGSAEVFLHEMVHAQTVALLNDGEINNGGQLTSTQKEAYADLVKLQKIAAAYVKDNNLTKWVYATKNIKELVAFGFTDERFQQEVLMNLDVSGIENRAALDSPIAIFLYNVAKLLGLKDHTGLSVLISRGSELFHPVYGWQDRQAYLQFEEKVQAEFDAGPNEGKMGLQLLLDKMVTPHTTLEELQAEYDDFIEREATRDVKGSSKFVSGVGPMYAFAPWTPETYADNYSTPQYLFVEPPQPSINYTLKTDKMKSQIVSREDAKARIKSWKEHAALQRGMTHPDGTTNASKVVLSLFDLSGEWSKPWVEAGYDVIQIDLQRDKVDIRDMTNRDFWDGYTSNTENVYAVIAAPPCTVLTTTNNRNWDAADKDGRTAESLDLLNSTLAIIEYLKPTIWAIENPAGSRAGETLKGKTEHTVGPLPKPVYNFEHRSFGDDGAKPTSIWGLVNPKMPLNAIESNAADWKGHKVGGKTVKAMNDRSETPEGFAYAFFMANNMLDNYSNRDGSAWSVQWAQAALQWEEADPESVKASMEQGASAGELITKRNYIYVDGDDNRLVYEKGVSASYQETLGRTTRGKPKGQINPDYRNVSLNNRPSRHMNAWHDLIDMAATDKSYQGAVDEMSGDPMRGSTLPPERQIYWLKKLFKDVYHIEVTETKNASIRMSIDQLLDGYRNLQGMAYVMGLPIDVMSNNRSIKLSLEKMRGYFGAYDQRTNTIHMPDRSNSFAHEWMHSFDHFMTKTIRSKEGLLTNLVVGGKYQATKPDTVEGAFIALVQRLFYEDNSNPEQVFNYLADVFENAPKGRAEYKSAQKQFWKQDGPVSRYAASSIEFDGDEKPYFGTPAEMIARAFEAYIAYKFAMSGIIGDEFVSKGDWAYLNDAEARMEKTYPRGDDRREIFQAFDDLFQQLATEYGQAAKKPDHIVPDYTDALLYDTARTSVWEQLKDDMEGVKERTKASVNRAFTASDDEMPWGAKNILFNGVAKGTWAMKAHVETLAAHYDRKGNKRAARLIRTAFAPAISSRRGDTNNDESYQRKVERRSNMLGNRVTRMLEQAGINPKRRSKAFNAELHAALTDPNAKPSEKVAKLAAGLRKLMDDIYYQHIDVEVQLGYVKENGYLSRLMNAEKVTRNQKKFERVAAQVYKIDIDDHLATLTEDEYILEIERMANLTESFAGMTHEELTENGLIDELIEEAAKIKATNWHAAIALEYTNPLEHGQGGMPDGKYKLQRALGPAADRLLKEFYNDDPIDVINTYIIGTQRHVTYQEMFRPGAKYDIEATQKAMLENANMHPEHVKLLMEYHASATGRTAQQQNWALGWTQTLGTMMLLSKATLSSLPETITAMQRTRSIRPLMGPIASVMTAVMNTASYQERRRIAELIGLVSSNAIFDQTIAARLSAEDASTKHARVLSNFFGQTLLTPLTNAQRVWMMNTGHLFVHELSVNYLTHKDSTQQELARKELLALGLKDSNIHQFAEWIVSGNGKLPKADDMFQTDTMQIGAMGEIWAVAVTTLVGEIIQNPQKTDRPWLASQPNARMMFGILGFLYSFWGNVVAGYVTDTHERAKIGGKKQYVEGAAWFSATFASLFAAHLVVTIGREFLTNGDRWDEWDEEDELAERLVRIAASRTGILGPFDHIYNLINAVRYQVDLGTSLAGAQAGFFLGNANKILFSALRDSENTNTAERNMVEGIYNITMQPLMAYTYAAFGPVGVATNAFLYPAYTQLNNYKNGGALADALFPEEEKKKKKSKYATGY